MDDWKIYNPWKFEIPFELRHFIVKSLEQTEEQYVKHNNLMHAVSSALLPSGENIVYIRRNPTEFLIPFLADRFLESSETVEVYNATEIAAEKILKLFLENGLHIPGQPNAHYEDWVVCVSKIYLKSGKKILYFRKNDRGGKHAEAFLMDYLALDCYKDEIEKVKVFLSFSPCRQD